MTEPVVTRSPRGRYAKGEIRREEILTAAERLFRARGYEGVSLRDIATDAGVTHPLVKHYFGSKNNLLLAVLDERAGEIAGRIEALERPEDMSTLAVEAASEHIVMDGYISAFTRLATEASDPAHPAHEYFKDRYERGVTINSRLLEEVREHGRLRTDIDSETLSRFILAVQDGLQLQWLFDPESVHLPSLVESFFDLILQPDTSAPARPEQ